MTNLPDIKNTKITSPIIDAKGLVKKIEGEITATLVAGVDVQIFAGEYVAIVGPSGSGKSSLLYMLGLLDQPSAGSLVIDNINTTELNEEQRALIRLDKIGYVFQSHFLLAEFTARENVMLPMLRAGKISKSEASNKAYEILSDLDLAKESERLPRQLSGGQSQRVAIARALANSPAIILADEPTGNLDSVSGKNVQKILSELAHQQGCAVMVVTHDTDFSHKTDRVISLVDGRLV